MLLKLNNLKFDKIVINTNHTLLKNEQKTK